MTLPLVSILVVHHRHYDLTARCLESLRSLRYPKVQIVVVDNGSQDDSLARLTRQFPEIEALVSERPLSFAAANNRAASQARGDLLWLLNNDTVVYEDTLCEMVAQHEGVTGAVILDLTVAGRQGPLQQWGGGEISLLTGTARLHLGRSPDYISGACLLVDADLYTALGGLCEDFHFYFEDTDFSLRARAQGVALRVAEGAVLMHQGGGSSGGYESAFADYHYSRGLAIFCRRYCRFPWFALAFNLLRRAKWRVGKGRPYNVWAIAQGVWNGLRGQPSGWLSSPARS